MPDQQEMTADNGAARLDEVDFTEFLRALRQGKLFIFGWAVAALLLAIFYLSFATTYYEARIVVQPVAPPGESSPLGALGSVGSLGAIAGLAGLGPASAPTEANLAYLRSREFLGRLVETEKLLPMLFPERWDNRHKRWYPLSWSAIQQRRIRSRLNGFDAQDGVIITDPRPTFREIYRRFEARRSIDRDIEAGLLTIAFEAETPQAAAHIANAMVSQANEDIRLRDAKEANTAIAYLMRQTDMTSNAALLDSIAKIAELQMQKRMLANVRAEYAFKVLDPALPPEESSRPHILLVLVTAILLGTFLSATAILASSFRRG